ncbi:MAG: tripartite tricarboxylate transporter permease [Burkholderiales bacterium]|nr:tripartite tricarboxylate transporter permease [Burkholderiales bacterium]
MMWENFTEALYTVFQLKTLLLMFLGTGAGLIAGAIPGFTIAMAVILTLPFTFSMPPLQGLATMIGVFVGGLSGGLMSGILTGIPGTPSSIATTFDGFTMARAGKPGLALGLGVWSSFFGGLISAVALVLLAPLLADLGLEFGPWDYFSLVLFALTITASLAGENMLKGLIAGAVGLLVRTIGEDDINGIARLNFGMDSLEAGFQFLPVLIGLFAFGQLLSDVKDRVRARQPLMKDTGKAVKVEHLQAIKTIFRSWVNLLRSSFIGIFVGVLPAAGGSISNILAYDQAKKASKTPEKFGTGTPDGIIAPESANNATAGGALMILMALGIPGDVVAAVMLGALLIHDVVPSPSFITDNAELAYGIFIAFFIAHPMMIMLQAVCLRGFLLVTRVPMYTLAAVILAYCAIGVFALENSTHDLWTVLIFGVVGYAMRVLKFPIAPMILGVVLGNMAELNLARAYATASDMTMFVSWFVLRPWSAFFLLLGAFSIGFPWYQKAYGKKKWTLAYIPLMAIALALPMFFMQGTVRTIVAAALLVWAAYALWKRHSGGWKLEVADDRFAEMKE